MSAVPTPSGRATALAMATLVVLVWLAIVVATGVLCRPWPGTEVLVPVVVVVAIPVVAVIGEVVGTALTLASVAILAMTTWGQVGGLVLVVATVVAEVALLGIKWGPGRD